MCNRYEEKPHFTSISYTRSQKTDPHGQFILYSILLFWGRRQAAFLRNHKCWQPLVPLLMDHILVEIEPGAEDIYLGAGSSTGGGSRSSIVMTPIAIEVKLRSLGVRLLYEVSRVQKLSEVDLRRSSHPSYCQLN
jgi:hypothetical protein